MDSRISRRSFVQGVSAMSASVIAAAELGCGGAAKVGPFAHAEAPHAVALGLSLDVYTFDQPLQEHIEGRGQGITLLDLIRVSQETRFDAIEATGSYFWDDVAARG